MDKLHPHAIKQVPLINICSLKRLCIHWQLYKSTGDTHTLDNDGIPVRYPTLVPNPGLCKLDDSLQTVRFANRIVGLKESNGEEDEVDEEDY